jgi:glycosyltransferase involved in cell wall biosynthesis
MVKRPKISVILPIYNVENYLGRCLDSVLNQTLLDIEIIGVNDGSTDGSADILTRYAALDHRLQIVDKENGGAASARNAGLAVASGELILFLDPDDYLAKNACERVYEEYIGGGADIIVFSSTPFPEIPEPEDWLVWGLQCRNRMYPKFHSDALFDEPGGNPFVWNRAFSRRFLKKNHLTFPEDIPFGEDLVFIFETMPLARRIQFISDRLHFYQCYRQGSLMNRYGGEIERRMRQHVYNVRIITDFWDKHGLLKKWRWAYVKWLANFIGSDLIVYRPSNSRQVIKETLEIMEEYQLPGGRYAAKLFGQIL